MLDSFQQKILLQALRAGKCVLYTGAGASATAKSATGHRLPTSGELAHLLWDLSGLNPSDFANQDLQTVFDHALKTKGERAVMKLLDEYLTVSDAPVALAPLAEIFWHRVYSTNVDNLLETLYKKAAGVHPRLETINALHHRPRERDQFLESIQLVKLNGSLSGSVDSVTFGARQYRQRIVKTDTWWENFVSDYATHVTVFIGTSLNEPLLEQALESRGSRGDAAVETRKKGFLVSDRIDPLLEARLKPLHVDHVKATAEEFALYLDELTRPRPDRYEVLANGSPHLAQFGKFVSQNAQLADSASAFLSAFSPVQPLDAPTAGYTSLFHYGAEAGWDDIAANLDIVREATASVRDASQLSIAAGHPDSFILYGHRGSGKTTALMRLATDAAALGVPSYFCNAEDAYLTGEAAPFIEGIQTRVLLVIDNLDRGGAACFEFLERARASKFAPVVIASARPHAIELATELTADSFVLGELSVGEIKRLVGVMRATRTLGKLQDKSDVFAYREFELRARRQMLVAMKEATNGLDFRRIIDREFKELDNEQLKLIYLTVCLATDVGLALPIELLRSATSLPIAELSAFLSRELKSIVVRVGQSKERYMARHAVIAEAVIKQSASHALLAKAYEELLPAMIAFMDAKGRGEPRTLFTHYKHLVNHREIYSRFGKDVEEAREVFSALEPYASNDPHFWLQHGSLELEYGTDLGRAELFLTRAQALAPKDHFVRVALGHLMFEQAIAANNREEALALRLEASETLEALTAERFENEHPRHILLTRSFRWIEIWEHDPTKKRDELERLASKAEDCCAIHPGSEHLAEVRDKIVSAYLSTATE